MLPDRLHALYQCALSMANDSDKFSMRELGPIHLLKYAYLADMEWARAHDGKTWTETMWRFHHFGPWDEDAYQEIEPAMSTHYVEIKKIESGKYDTDFVRYRLKRAFQSHVEIPLELRLYLKRVVSKYNSDTSALLHYVYNTPPMTHAAPGEPLRFSTVLSQPSEKIEVELSERPSLTAKQRKQRQAKIEQFRSKIQGRLSEEATQAIPSGRIPRYDDIYQNGVDWLNSLAGEPIPTGSVTIEVHPDIWHSPIREDGGVD